MCWFWQDLLNSPLGVLPEVIQPWKCSGFSSTAGQGRLGAVVRQLQELEASNQGAMQEDVIKQLICNNLEDNEVGK